MKEDITAVLEGSFSENPHVLNYEPFCGTIPDNASVIRIGSRRFVLAFRGNYDRSFDVIATKKYKGAGWQLLDETADNPNWPEGSFDMPRAICTFDGRIFVNDFCDRNHDYARKAIKKVWRDSIRVLYGLDDTNRLNSRRGRVRTF